MVKAEALKFVDESRMDAFLANCDCRYESRNTVMLKVCLDIDFLYIISLPGRCDFYYLRYHGSGVVYVIFDLSTAYNEKKTTNNTVPSK